MDFSGTRGPNNDSKITAGSIEGAGHYYLGSNQLAVGRNNISTMVSGIISDCGPGLNCANPSATGGSLVKLGTGTLTFSGANTYTGGTVLRAGELSFPAPGRSARHRARSWLRGPAHLTLEPLRKRKTAA